MLCINFTKTKTLIVCSKSCYWPRIHCNIVVYLTAIAVLIADTLNIDLSLKLMNNIETNLKQFTWNKASLTKFRVPIKLLHFTPVYETIKLGKTGQTQVSERGSSQTIYSYLNRKFCFVSQSSLFLVIQRPHEMNVVGCMVIHCSFYN